MTKILKAMPFGSARDRGKNRIKSVEGLDSSLLFDTEECSVYRWLKIQANDICGLFFKLRVIAGDVTTQPMRLNAEMAPETAHTGLENFDQPIATPVARTVDGTLTRELQDTCLGLRGTGPPWTRAIMRIESCQTLLWKALLHL